MFYIVYKITNLINDKVYIGKHQTKNINDEYMGSGTALKRDIDKYGIDVFTKDILYVLDSKKEMDKVENLIVDEYFVSSDNTYNLKIGGGGGFDHINSSGKNLYNGHDEIWDNLVRPMGTRKHSSLLKSDLDYRKRWEQKISNSLIEWHKNNNNPFLGKKHTEESRRKIGKASSIHQKGKKNSQYGRRWIYNDVLKESRPVKKGELDVYLSEGWTIGRKMKF